MNDPALIARRQTDLPGVMLRSEPPIVTFVAHGRSAERDGRILRLFTP